jgi:hypothetical protein
VVVDDEDAEHPSHIRYIGVWTSAPEAARWAFGAGVVETRVKGPDWG